MNSQKIVIKVGTNVLQRPNGKLDYNLISELGEQIAAIHDKGYQVLFVTSGAVGAGRELCSFENEKRAIVRKQMMAAVGQVRLMQIYSDFFMEHQIPIAQILVTRSDFGDRSSYLNIRNTLEGLLAAGVVPVINENDVVGTEELALKFGENDKLAVYVAALIGADQLFYLTAAQGLLKYSDEYPNGELIEEVTEYSEELLSYCKPVKSSGGTGGMESKIIAAGLTTSFGIHTYIADGKVPNVVLRILEGEKFGTHFVASGKKIRSYQKWLAAGALSRGKLTVDLGAEKALRSKKSLLVSGVTRTEGIFVIKDLVDILNPSGIKIGVGEVKLSSRELRKYLKQKEEKPTSPGNVVIHCDHLFLQ